MSDYVNDYFKLVGRNSRRLFRQMELADGTKMSVQANCEKYSSPRDSEGPYDSVEIGYPSEKIDELMPYCDDPEYPTKTVYGYVPVSVVNAIIEERGGIAGDVMNELTKKIATTQRAVDAAIRNVEKIQK